MLIDNAITLRTEVNSYFYIVVLFLINQCFFPCQATNWYCSVQTKVFTSRNLSHFLGGLNRGLSVEKPKYNSLYGWKGIWFIYPNRTVSFSVLSFYLFNLLIRPPGSGSFELSVALSEVKSFHKEEKHQRGDSKTKKE